MAKLGRRPKVHLDRLKSRYNWTGGRYQALMSQIIEQQSGFISRRIAEIQKGKLDKHARIAQKRMGVNLVVPDIRDVLPQRSVFIKKGAERGKLLTDTLRTQLTANLRETVVKYIAAGKSTMGHGAAEDLLPGRGLERGRMNPDLVKQFEGKIRKTFASYSKRDPEIGVPANVSVIATTEVYSTINEIKHTYNLALAARNPGTVQTKKVWRHFPELSKEPRPGHAAVSGKSAPIADAFKVPVYERQGTIKSGPNKGRPRWKRTRQTVSMQHPHDPGAPISEIAACHCLLDYQLEISPLTEKGKSA